MLKLKIGILMGGVWTENEVSFNSGRTVFDNLDTSKFTPIPIFQNKEGFLYILPQKFLYRGKIADFESRLSTEAQRIFWDDLPHLIDFAFIAMHGRYAEDGTLQGMLEMLQIPYLASKVFASAFTRDKSLAYKYLVKNNIRVPNYIEVDKYQIINIEQEFDKILKKLECKSLIKNNQIKTPLILKPQSEGSSFGVYVAKNICDLKNLIITASTSVFNIYQSILIEEKLSGSEFTAMVITDPQSGQLITLPPTEVIIEEDKDILDYDQKYMPGRATKHTPARFSNEVIEKINTTSQKIVKLFNIKNFNRIDGFVVDNEIIIIDINTISGMAPSSFLFRQAAEIGLTHSMLIENLINTELKMGIKNAQ